jgi:L-serine dehydratase
MDRVTGSSIGGGKIEIISVNDFDVKFSAHYPTLLIFHDDRPGMIANVTRLLSDEGVNIGYMDVDRKSRSGDALTVIETDEPIPPSLRERIRNFPAAHRVGVVDFSENGVTG